MCLTMQRLYKTAYIYKKVRKDSFGRKSTGIDIFPNNIDIHRKNSKILQRKQYFAQSFEKMVQITMKDAEGISGYEHTDIWYEEMQ